ncbi:MAG: type II toxin-antitoxin system RelE/ParE family toxin [Lachnospiraceae bacterium]|nr:type II toxin-antitoxin system RelE/ParE family toxin [Lachnospiraceae bacterium]
MQPLNLEWSKDALEDLDVIWEYITEDSIDNADSFIDQLIDESYKICEVPQSGTVIPEIQNPNYREHYYKGYTIIYEINNDRIIVHEVYNQKRIHIRTYKR